MASSPSLPPAAVLHSARAKKYASHEWTIERLTPYFYLTQIDACQILGVGKSTLKRICTRLGIKRWPQLQYLKARRHAEIQHQSRAMSSAPSGKSSCKSSDKSSDKSSRKSSDTSSESNSWSRSQSSDYTTDQTSLDRSDERICFSQSVSSVSRQDALGRSDVHSQSVSSDCDDESGDQSCPTRSCSKSPGQECHFSFASGRCTTEDPSSAGGASGRPFSISFDFPAITSTADLKKLHLKLLRQNVIKLLRQNVMLKLDALQRQIHDTLASRTRRSTIAWELKSSALTNRLR